MRDGSGRALALAVLLTVLTGCEGGASDEPHPSAISTTASGTIPTGTASIEPGAHRPERSSWSVADFAVTLPDGWTVQEGHTYLKHSDADDELGIQAYVVDEVFTDSCQGGEVMEVGPTALDLAAALLTQRGPAKAHGPSGLTLGGAPALYLYYKLPKNLDLTTCTLEEDGLRIWHSSSVDRTFVLPPGVYAWVYILEVDGERQVFVAHFTEETSRKDVRELQAVLDSIRIEP